MRAPAAEGFYPFDKTGLEKQVKKFLVATGKKRDALGIISPHAGYIFSGSTAGKTYASASGWEKNIVMLGPNHTGMGREISRSSDDWKTPLGIVKNENRFRKIPVSEEAHVAEHSLEVQLPFLQTMLADFKINPITLSYLRLEDIRKLSGELVSGECSYIASSDFTHYGPNYGYMPANKGMDGNFEYAKKMDMEAIELICKIEPEKFYEFVMHNKMTICGFVPITLMLFICRKLGARRGELIDFSSSYDTHPSSSFVNYAGIIIEK